MDTLIAFASDYGLFLAKAATVVIAIGLILGWIVNAVGHVKSLSSEGLEIKNINERLNQMADSLYQQLLGKSERKARAKRKKAEAKHKAKEQKLGKARSKGRLFVLDFDGDIRASAVTNLREEISAVLQVAESDDEVLVRLESAGGMVHSYGLAASQLKRIRDKGIHLTAAVDKLAASGGYMMACVADRIIAAPFSIIGSIGVVGQLPNFNRLLKEKNIDFEMHTAGAHKRTLTMLGENTDDGRAKFREELEATHGLFKAFVADNRAGLDIDAVATGEHWHGSRALELKLIDELATSDDYLLTAAAEDREIYAVAYKTKTPLSQRLAENVSTAVRRAGAGLLFR